MRGALSAGYDRAFATIFDSHITTLISSVILIIFGTGTIKGNHITLKFPYPGAEFRDHLDYDRVKDRWRLVIDMGPPNHVEEFSNWAFDRVSSP